jgi:hypothetical protein
MGRLLLGWVAATACARLLFTPCRPRAGAQAHDREVREAVLAADTL